MRLLIIALCVLFLAGLTGCQTSLGFGDDNGVGVKSTVAKDGKILEMEPTDGNGKAR